MRKYIRKADYIAKYGEEAWAVESAKRNKLKKADYIAKYGEEAWAVEAARRKKWGKKIRKTDYIAKYGEEAWEVEVAKRSSRNKRWREKHHDCRKTPEQRKYDKQYSRQYSRQYRQEHKEERKEYSRQWREEHPDYNKQYYNAYYDTQFGRAVNLKNGYIKQDKRKGFPTDKNVDADWIVENIFNSSCIYCGESDWAKLGCDRIDNTKGHTPDNVVCSCWDCNNDRNDKFTVEEFIQYRKLHPREQPIPDTDDKVIDAWIGKFKISSNRINF